MTPNNNLAGNFAPPFTDEELHATRQAIETQPLGSETREALDALYTLATTWWNLPESATAPIPHPVGLVTDGAGRAVPAPAIRPLCPTIVAQLGPLTPWHSELARYLELFATLPEPLHHYAHKLAWLAFEIANGREPLTNETIAATP